VLKLSSNFVFPLSEITESETNIRRITDNPDYSPALRAREYLLVRNERQQTPSGFAGYFFFEKPSNDVPANSFLLEPALSYLCGGDIVRINPKRNALRALYRKHSPHNALLMTERCNNFCLMCSQPPKDIDDSYIIEDVLRMIPLMSPETKEITITGGEPTLLGQNLVQIIHCLKNHLPSTAVHILSNGRGFKDWDYAQSIAKIRHHDLMIGIPVYSDISSIHDYVVQADGAFDDTIRGIINLKSVGVKVEIRVVLHRLTYERLPDLARFICRNLTFCDHVALMGLEMTGFTKINLDKLWIDPKEYQPQLREAVEILAQARMTVSIYNHQLCILDPSLVAFNRKSISDWKNEYMPECENCTRKSECGGFFSSAKLRYSDHIRPFHDEVVAKS
jgi:His-Xaa-Ser system radical SAM maturase HxsC